MSGLRALASPAATQARERLNTVRIGIEMHTIRMWKHGVERVDVTPIVTHLGRNRQHSFQLILDRGARLAQFVFILQSHPELHGISKYLGQAQRGIRRDAALAQHDLVDAPRGHADRVGQSGLADLHWQ